MIKLITHNDLDGVGCYVVAKYFLDTEIEVSYCSYKNVNETVLDTMKQHEKYKKIFITDISVNDEVAKELDNIRHKVKLFDHHPTAKYLNKYEWAYVEEWLNSEEKTCGTRMLYNYLNDGFPSTTLSTFIEKVRRYDTWLWKEKYNDNWAKMLNDLMYIVGKEEFAEDMINKVKTNQILFDDMSLKILELRQKEIDRYIEKKDKNIIVKNILGYNAGVVFADNFISELGNKLSELHPELDFIAMINQETISYRTIKENVNLSEVAKSFGGGGHPKASGSQVNENDIKKFIDILFNN